MHTYMRHSPSVSPCLIATCLQFTFMFICMLAVAPLSSSTTTCRLYENPGTPQDTAYVNTQ